MKLTAGVNYSVHFLKFTLDYVDGEYHDDICVIMTDEIFNFGSYVESIDLDQVSISPTFYTQYCHTKVFYKALPYFNFLSKEYWYKSYR